MYDSLFDFFYTIIFNNVDSIGDTYLSGYHFTLFNVNGVSLQEYFSHTCSIISIIIILVLCCLFIYRLIRLIGRLFSGGTL